MIMVYLDKKGEACKTESISSSVKYRGNSIKMCGCFAPEPPAALFGTVPNN